MKRVLLFPTNKETRDQRKEVPCPKFTQLLTLRLETRFRLPSLCESLSVPFSVPRGIQLRASPCPKEICGLEEEEEEEEDANGALGKNCQWEVWGRDVGHLPIGGVTKK